MSSKTTAEAISDAFISGPDSYGEEPNVVDAIGKLAYSAKRIADAITPNINGGPDETGSHVESLTEAVMGMTAGLVRIAEAVSELASAVRHHKG